MKIYCHQCGTAIAYANEEVKPNFCHKCGANVGSNESSSSEEESEAYDNVKFNSSLSKLEVEIERHNPRSIKLGEAMGTLDPENQSVDDFNTPNFTKEQSLNQIQKEASTLRKKD